MNNSPMYVYLSVGFYVYVHNCKNEDCTLLLSFCLKGEEEEGRRLTAAIDLFM